VLRAQETINVLLAGDQADFGVYADHPRAAGAALGDIGALASLALAYPDRTELQKHLPADLLSAYIEHGPCPAIRSRGNFLYIRRVRLPTSPLTAAVAAVVALQILEQKHVFAGGQAMRWLISGPRRHKPAATPRATVGPSTRNTAILEAVEIKAFAPLLNGTAQLRHRCESDFPTRPCTDTEATAQLIRSLPTELWPDWSLRLVAPGPKYCGMPAILACAIVLVGTELSVQDVVGHLGSGILAVTVARRLDRLSREPHWRDISIALSKLSAHLVRHPSPIDYGRRRTLDYSKLLRAEEWRHVCRDTRTGEGRAGKIINARCYLYEMISGRSARRFSISGRPLKRTAHNSARSTFGGRYRPGDFALALTPQLAARLHAEGQHFLASHSIDEPLTWHPPLPLLDGLYLPGRDPALVDLGALHRLANKGGMTIDGVARELGTTGALVTHRLTQHPAPLHRPEGRAPRISKISAAMREAMTAPVLTELYYHEGLSISAIAKHFGTSNGTVRSIAASQRIKLRRVNIRDAPEVLLPALSGQCGWQRLERFAAVVDCPSVSAAAAALNFPPSTLNAQMVRLETDLGGRLLNRARTSHPMTPTPFGDVIAQAVREWLSTRTEVSKPA